MEKNNISLNNNSNSNSYYEGNDFFLDYTEEKEDRDRITSKMVEAARKRLKLEMNPQVIEEAKEQLRENNQTLETYRDNPLFKYAGINVDERLEANKKLKEYLNVAQYNSGQNLFKNGAKDIILPYIDEKGEQKTIELNGNQFITEDTRNIYIREEDGNETIIPKQREEGYSIKDKYTEYEQKQLRKNQYAYLTDEQWAEELTKVKKEYQTLSKLQTERMLALQADIPDDLLKEIDDLDTIGVEELMYLTGIKERQEPLIESAMLKQKTGDKLNENELNALWTRKYINYAIQRRGVAYGAEAFTGIVGNIKNNVSAIASTAITDAGLYLTLKGLGALSPHGTGIAVIGSMIKLAKKFSDYRKAHKYINYGYNALKYTGLTMASAKLDTLTRAHIVDRAMGNVSDYLFDDPTYLRTETKEERLRQKRNNRMLEFTEKGGLFTMGLSESMDKFLNYQDNVEQFNEAWSERFVDGVVDTVTGFIPIPKRIRNSLFAKVLKKINNIPAIAGTPLHSLASEHLEELFGITMNHAFRANDPDTTLNQSIKEYLNPRNFSLSTINIMVAGGLMRQVSNVFTKNENGNQTQSLARTIVEKGLEKQFENNPNEDFGDITKDNYKDKLDTLSETEIDKLAKDIIDKEGKEQIERYNTLMDKIENQWVNLTGDDKTAKNLINIYKSFYAQKALETGENRYNIAKRFALEIKSIAEEKGIDLAVDNIVNEVYGKAVAAESNNSFSDYLANYNMNPNGQNSSHIIDRASNIYVDYNSLKQINDSYQKRLKREGVVNYSNDKSLPMESWEYIKTALNNNKIDNYFYDKSKKSLYLEIDNEYSGTTLIKLTGDNLNHLDNIEITKDQDLIDRWKQNKHLIELGKEKEETATLSDIINKTKAYRDTLPKPLYRAYSLKDNNSLIVDYRNRDNRNIREGSFVLLTNDFIVDQNTLDNIEGKVNWLELKRNLESKKFSTFFFNEKEGKLLIEFKDSSTIITLSGKGYNYIEKVNSFKDEEELKQWLKENKKTIKRQIKKGMVSIESPIAEAKNRMGENPNNDSLPNIYNLIGTKQIDREDLKEDNADYRDRTISIAQFLDSNGFEELESQEEMENDSISYQKNYSLIPYDEQSYNLFSYRDKEEITEGAETQEISEEDERILYGDSKGNLWYKDEEQENTTQNQSDTQNTIENTQQIDFENNKNLNNNTNNFEAEVQKNTNENPKEKSSVDDIKEEGDYHVLYKNANVIVDYETIRNTKAINDEELDIYKTVEDIAGSLNKKYLYDYYLDKENKRLLIRTSSYYFREHFDPPLDPRHDSLLILGGKDYNQIIDYQPVTKEVFNFSQNKNIEPRNKENSKVKLADIIKEAKQVMGDGNDRAIAPLDSNSKNIREYIDNNLNGENNTSFTLSEDGNVTIDSETLRKIEEIRAEFYKDYNAKKERVNSHRWERAEEQLDYNKFLYKFDGEKLYVRATPDVIITLSGDGFKHVESMLYPTYLNVKEWKQEKESTIQSNEVEEGRFKTLKEIIDEVNKKLNNDTNNLNTEVQKINETETKEQKEIKELRNFIENAQNKNSNIDNWDYTLSLKHDIKIDKTTLDNTKTILSNYTSKSIEAMTPKDWYDVQKALEDNKFSDYYINNNNKEIILDLNDKLVYLNDEDFKHVDKVIKFKDAKDRLRWEEENEALTEGKENRQAKSIDEIIEESKNPNNDTPKEKTMEEFIKEKVIFVNLSNRIPEQSKNLNDSTNNLKEEVQKIDVPYKVRKSKDYRGANILLATNGNYEDEENNAVILNKNNAIVINRETLKNIEEFNQIQRTNTGKYPPNYNFNHIKYYLDNDIFKSYYFNDKTKTLLIELEDNVLISLSGEEYNYLDNVMVFSSPVSLNKYIEKDNYKSQTGAKTIAETRAEAKNVMGKSEIKTPDIYNKLARNEINIEDLIDKEEDGKEFEGKDSLTTYALDYSRNKDKYKNSFFIFKNKDNNVNLIIDGNSIENSKLSKNKYLYPVNWEDIREGLNEKNMYNNSSEYYLDKQNRKVVVNASNNVAILSGENYNYIESFKSFKDYRAANKWLKDNYGNDAKFNERKKPIANIVEEAKAEMGKGANDNVPNIYNKIGSNEIDIKDIDNRILKYKGNNLVGIGNNKTTYRQQSQDHTKGQTHLLKNGNVVMEFFKGKFDESTLIHETAHYFLLVDQALAKEGNEAAKQHIRAIEEWTAAQFKSEKDRDLYMHERFARGYELYIRTGKYSNPELKESYDYFKGFLENIYKNVEDLNLDVNNKQMYEFFDKYLYNPQKYSNWIYDDDDKDKENKTETKEETVAEEDVEGNALSEEEKAIKYDNSLSSLILKQSTENSEHLLNSIKDKIKKLTEEIAWQSKGKKDEESKLVKEKLLMKYFKERVKLLKTAADRISNETKETTETTPQEDKQKQDFIRDYQTLRQKDYDTEKEAKYADFINGNIDRIDEIGDQDPLVEEQKKYDRKIMQMAETLWNSFKTERKELENSLLNKINTNRENLIEETERQGGDLDYIANIKEEYRPYKNIEEMMADYEDRVKNKKFGIKDCVLAPSEYTELKEFIKKKLGGHIDSLLETIDSRTKALEEAQSKAAAYQGFHDYALEKIDELKTEINKQKEFNEEFQKTLGLTPENLKTTMELTGRPKSSEILKEVVNSAQIDSENYETQVLRTLVNKLSNNEDIIKMIDTAKRHNKNTDYIVNQINKNNAVETKKAIQNTMNNILRGTVSFNVKTGHLYGLTYYEDSGLLSSIKRYNRLSMKQAGVELFNLEEARKNGTNKDTQVEYELKRNMLYFRSTPATQLDTKDQLEMLESLSTFVKYSKERQNEVKKEQQDKLNTLKTEVKDAIKDRKSKMKFGLGYLFNLITTHFGNLPTQLEYLLGKDTAKLFDLYNYETSFKVNYQEKTDKLFTRINDILFEGNKERDVEALFKDWNNPLTRVQPYKQDYEGNDSYRVVRLKQPMEKLVDRLLTELEMEKRDEDENILFLKRVQNQAKKGSKSKDYRYNLPEYEFLKLEEIISKTTLSNRDILADNIKKSYNEIEAYDVNTWGLMYYHLLKQNLQTKNLIFKKYRRTDIEILDSLLGKQSKEFFDIANAIYNSVQDRNELNALHVLVFNRDMGYVENYFPRRSFHDQDFSLFDLLGLNFNNNGQEDMSSVSAIQSRSHNAIPKLNENPLLLALKHIKETELTKTVAVGMKQFKDVFGDKNVRSAIVDLRTEGNYNSLMNYMDALKNSYRKLDDGLDQILNKLVGNWAGSVTNTPSVFIKQISSIWALMEKQSGKEFTTNLFEGFKNPKQIYDLMMEKLPYLKVRFKEDENDKLLETLKNVKLEKENPLLLKLNKLGDKATNFFRMLLISDRLKKFTKHSLTEYGDRVAVIFGGYARYKTLIDSGMSEQEAILNTEKQIVETQQSDLTSLKSKFMLDNSNYTRWAGMFKSQDRQYFQKLLTDYMRILTKEGTNRAIAKNLILYHAILPLSMTIAQGLINAIYGKKEKNWWEYTKMFGLLSLTSFLPFSLLSQSVILDFDMNRKRYENMFFTLQGALTRLPLQAYYKIGFDRYYTPSILNTEKKKKIKENRRKKRDKEKMEKEKKKRGW